MIAAVCIGDGDGMLFNRRRVSRDRAQQEDLLALCGDGRLWLAPYSAPLFAWAAERVTADDGFLEKAGPGEVCFVEDRALAPAADRVEAAVLYRWNRAYPADVRFDFDLTDFRLEERTEFPGTSHERITREIYRRKER
ncbi:MAG: ribonuclease Z [Oscillospiraceae bacterium]|nr:ribonuclease Z [Oscillospiraceae bacterium]